MMREVFGENLLIGVRQLSSGNNMTGGLSATIKKGIALADAKSAKGNSKLIALLGTSHKVLLSGLNLKFMEFRTQHGAHRRQFYSTKNITDLVRHDPFLDIGANFCSQNILYNDLVPCNTV
jgi:hypothetical protein